MLAEAQQRLTEFIPRISDCASCRNDVVEDHAYVSRLSTALRHRILRELKVAEAAIGAHGFPASENFVQEVYWHLYWESWLEMRPQVWHNYREGLQGFSKGVWHLSEKVFAGNSSIEMIDHFARELLETGCLYNHARM